MHVHRCTCRASQSLLLECTCYFFLESRLSCIPVMNMHLHTGKIRARSFQMMVPTTVYHLMTTQTRCNYYYKMTTASSYQHLHVQPVLMNIYIYPITGKRSITLLYCLLHLMVSILDLLHQVRYSLCVIAARLQNRCLTLLFLE